MSLMLCTFCFGFLMLEVAHFDTINMIFIFVEANRWNNI
jgi:hypothetical protein